MTAPTLSLDHVVIAVTDLHTATTELSRLLGRSPSWRGRHPPYGTANVLYRLDNAYLELLAPDPGGVSTTWSAQLRRFLALRGDGLYAVALGTTEIAATLTAVRERGLSVQEPAAGEGVDLISGASRRWSNARVPQEETGGTSLFFIEHYSPREALPPAPPVADPSVAVSAVAALSIETADAAGATKLWHDQVGLPLAQTEGGWRLDFGNAALLLFAGAGEAEAPHRWQHFVLAAPRLTGLADRLERDRLPFEQGEFREGSGVRLDCCGVDFLIVEAE
jgi:hypothetical protein